VVTTNLLISVDAFYRDMEMGDDDDDEDDDSSKGT
jgi:hypothetical protein